jgi:hypothetical protein
MPLGLLPGATYDQAEVTIEPGRSVVLYSDALPEAHDPSGEMYGFPRVLERVGSAADTDLIDLLLSSLHGFTGPDWEQEDDITIVALRRSAQGADSFVATDGDEQAGNEEEAVDVEAPAADEGEEIVAFTVPSEPGNERGVMDRIASAVADLVPDEDRLNRLKTAVAEATMNAIEHGNQNRSDLLVEVRVFASEQALVVRITDQGAGGSLPDAV